MTTALSVPLHLPESATAARPSPERGAPCTMVILGASGDLTRRKLVPALFHLMADGRLADDFSILGVGRARMGDDAFRDTMRTAAAESLGEEMGAPETWETFAARLEYHAGDLNDASTYAALRERVEALEQESESRGGPPRGRLFYLALPPSVYETTLVRLSESGLAPRLDVPDRLPWARIVIEKPFGHSLESAQALNRVVCARFAEHQIFRIDHFLGKDTVQNLLVFRFANSIFEPVWNRDHIHHVQITAAETVGVGSRAGYYEEAGVVRDMFQNHLLQLLALTAMEPPVAFRDEAVRTEKTKVLDAMRPMSPEEVQRSAVRGQYGRGAIDGKPVRGYLEEDRVAPASMTPTYAAVRLVVDNWRWQGVPFFLRSGKRMSRRATEIAIRFRHPPHLMFPQSAGQRLPSNVLAFRIQPDEGLSLCFEVKVPDIDLQMATANMDFSYAEGFGTSAHSAYETLLVDCMLGDATLFTRSDAVEAAWRVVDPILAAWEESPPPGFPNYAAGSRGPAAADDLIARDDAVWRSP
ncbi:MAG TPA: glucose-6-phosphate dehydrogenase [Gemmatimonadaceae bacterium]|nr:glucose-6-phosphate dehydrogenase [Gemmatimonadaceae bacterium]